MNIVDFFLQYKKRNKLLHKTKKYKNEYWWTTLLKKTIITHQPPKIQLLNIEWSYFLSFFLKGGGDILQFIKKKQIEIIIIYTSTYLDHADAPAPTTWSLQIANKEITVLLIFFLKCQHFYTSAIASSLI